MDPRLVACLQRLEQGRRAINDMAPNSYSHTCYREYCNPLSERDFIQMGVFAPNTAVIMSNVWLCRYSSFHICSDARHECNLVSEGVCPISGRVFHHQTTVVGGADYDADDARTWNANGRMTEAVGKNNDVAVFEPVAGRKRQMMLSGFNMFDSSPASAGDKVAVSVAAPPEGSTAPKGAVAKKRGIFLSAKEARSRMEALVHGLLYDERPREALLKRQMQEIETELHTDWPAYAKYCRENCIIMDIIRQRMIDDLRIVNAKLVEVEISTDAARERYYVAVLMEVHDKIVRVLGSPKVDIEAMGIAVLYLMGKQGFTVAGLQVLPADSFLCQRLPQINDLPAFSHRKKKITTGAKLIKKLYATALQQGLSRQELTLSTAVPTPLTVTEPERLFMPTSRLKR